MINELDILDHTILDESKKCMLMLIFDSEDLWKVDKQNDLSLIKYKRMLKDKKLEHLLYLEKKIESYVNYILNDGIVISFPNCTEHKVYSYEIRVITNFIPDDDYLSAIDKLNKYIARSTSNVIITHEKRIN